MERLERVVVACREAPRRRAAERPDRLGDAEVGGLEHRPHHALGSNRVEANEVAVAREQAAEILRPRPVEGTVEDDVTDIPGAQVLRLGREAEEGVDLAVYEQLHWLGRGTGDPVDIRWPGRGRRRRRCWPKTDEWLEPRAGTPDGPALQVGDTADLLGREQLETARMNPRQHRDGLARIDQGHVGRDEIDREVEFAERPASAHSTTPASAAI